MSLGLQKVPRLWKVGGSYLQCNVVQNKMLAMTQGRLDLLQFACKTRRSFQVANRLNLVLMHLGENKKHARSLFIDELYSAPQPYIPFEFTIIGCCL